jgi:hypothetical protein
MAFGSFVTRRASRKLESCILRMGRALGWAEAIFETRSYGEGHFSQTQGEMLFKPARRRVLFHHRLDHGAECFGLFSQRA